MRQGSCRTVEQPPLTYRVVEKRVSETARPFFFMSGSPMNEAMVLWFQVNLLPRLISLPLVIYVSQVRTDERRASCGARSNVRPCSEPDDPNDHAQVIFFGPAYDTRQSTSFTFSQKDTYIAQHPVDFTVTRPSTCPCTSTYTQSSLLYDITRHSNVWAHRWRSCLTLTEF